MSWPPTPTMHMVLRCFWAAPCTHACAQGARLTRLVHLAEKHLHPHLIPYVIYLFYFYLAVLFYFVSLANSLGVLIGKSIHFSLTIKGISDILVYKDVRISIKFLPKWEIHHLISCFVFILGNLLQATAQILNIILQLYMWIIIIRALLSWVNPDPYNPIVQFLYSITEPVLYRIRQLVPMTGIGIDFSPIIVLLAIVFLQGFLVESLAALGARLQ